MEKKFFVERYRKLGWKFSEVAVKKSLRVNILKISKNELRKRLELKGVKLKETGFSRNGLLVEDSEFSVGSTVEYLLGYYYIQDAASQAAAELLDPSGDDLVLDCCAAPGGKTTHLSQLMRNRGIIVALDKKSKRLIALKNNLERIGCKNVIVYNMDALNVSSLGITFDKILLDAPCSGNFAQETGWFEKRDLDGIKGNAENQKKLLETCYKVLRPGGKLVYATCSLEPEENEENAKWFADKFDVKLVSQQRFWPSEKNKGLFTAKFIRKK